MDHEEAEEVGGQAQGKRPQPSHGSGLDDAKPSPPPTWLTYRRRPACRETVNYPIQSLALDGPIDATCTDDASPAFGKSFFLSDKPRFPLGHASF